MNVDPLKAPFVMPPGVEVTEIHPDDSGLSPKARTTFGLSQILKGNVDLEPSALPPLPPEVRA